VDRPEELLVKLRDPRQVLREQHGAGFGLIRQGDLRCFTGISQDGIIVAIPCPRRRRRVLGLLIFAVSIVSNLANLK